MHNQTNLDPTTNRSRNPQWWNEQHTSTWDRVKEALRRDWEQTKSDFSSKGGTDLNQNVGDTVKQAAGQAPVPPLSAKTRPDDPKEMAKLVEKEIKERGKVEQKVIAAKTDVAVAQVEAQAQVARAQQTAAEKVSTVQADASKAIAEVQQKAGERVADARSWDRVEPAVRYGYAARSQYADVPAWNDQIDSRLQKEWTQFNTGGSWDDVRQHVRHGWDSANRNRG